MAKRKPTTAALPAGDPFRPDDNLELTRQSDDIVLHNASLVAITMSVFHHAKNLSRDGYTIVPEKKGRR